MQEIILTLNEYRQLVEIMDKIRGLVGISAGELKDLLGAKIADWEENQIKFYLTD